MVFWKRGGRKQEDLISALEKRRACMALSVSKSAACANSVGQEGRRKTDYYHTVLRHSMPFPSISTSRTSSLTLLPTTTYLSSLPFLLHCLHLACASIPSPLLCSLHTLPGLHCFPVLLSSPPCLLPCLHCTLLPHYYLPPTHAC